MPDENLSPHALWTLQDRMDERRRQEPLRQRILGTIVAGLQMVSEGRFISGSLGYQECVDERIELLKRGMRRFQSDAFFHAVAEQMFQDIMHDVRIGERE